MFVRDRMTANPITISPSTPVYEALKIMKENRIRRLPVVDGGVLVGIVTELDLLRVSPSPATSLSIYEIHYLMSKVSVKEAMTVDVITVDPGTLIEDAALLLRQRKIGGLPVLERGKLVGIITETDIFDAFLEHLGSKQGGLRITFQVQDRAGELCRITQTLKELGINIQSVVVSHPGGGMATVVMRLQGDQLEQVTTRLKDEGYAILDSRTNGAA